MTLTNRLKIAPVSTHPVKQISVKNVHTQILLECKLLLNCFTLKWHNDTKQTSFKQTRIKKLILSQEVWPGGLWFYLKNGHPRPAFSFIFVFSNKHTIFKANKCGKCPSNIGWWDLNPRASEHESPPITIILQLQPILWLVNSNYIVYTMEVFWRAHAWPICTKALLSQNFYKIGHWDPTPILFIYGKRSTEDRFNFKATTTSALWEITSRFVSDDLNLLILHRDGGFSNQQI